MPERDLVKTGITGFDELLVGGIPRGNVILVEDILDTGLTLSYLRTVVLAHHPRAMRTAALLDKPDRRRIPIEADYVGFTIPDEFVVGYGLDYAEKYWILHSFLGERMVDQEQTETGSSRPEAEREVRSGLATHPEDGMARALLALCLANLGRTRAAVSQARQAVRRAPDLATAHAALAFALAEEGPKLAVIAAFVSVSTSLAVHENRPVVLPDDTVTFGGTFRAGLLAARFTTTCPAGAGAASVTCPTPPWPPLTELTLSVSDDTVADDPLIVSGLLIATSS